MGKTDLTFTPVEVQLICKLYGTAIVQLMFPIPKPFPNSINTTLLFSKIDFCLILKVNELISEFLFESLVIYAC